MMTIIWSTRAAAVASGLLLFTFQSLEAFSVTPNAQRSLESTVRTTYNRDHLYPFKESLHLGAIRVQGLLEESEFEELSNLDSTIRLLRRQLPVLLSRPLADEVAKLVFTKDTRLIVGNESSSKVELATSRDELLVISNVIVAAVSAMTRPAQFLGDLLNATAPSPLLNVQLLVFVDGDFILQRGRIEIIWEANLVPGFESQLGQQYVQGTSLFILKNGQVQTHRLRNVRWNDNDLDASSIGEILANLRRTLLGLSNAMPPFLQGLLSPPSDARRPSFPWEPLLADEPLQEYPLAECFVVEQRDPLNRTNSIKGAASIDNYGKGISKNASTIPLPGSKTWEEYAAVHRVAHLFVNETIPFLAGLSTAGSDSSPLVFGTLFDKNVTLFGVDGKELLRGSARVTSFYKLLASWYQLGFVEWKLKNATVLDYDLSAENNTCCTVRIEIRYESTMDLPGLGRQSVTDVSGTDVYMLTIRKSSKTVRIKDIQQLHVDVGGRSNPRFMKSMIGAMEAERWTSSSVDAPLFLLEWWRKATGMEERKIELSGVFPSRSDEAALTVYRIMESLHEQPIASSKNAPASQYMDDDVVVVGYLGETLLRSKENYQRVYRLLTSGLLQRPQSSSVRVELTKTGSIQCRWTIHLDLSSPSLAQFQRMLLSDSQIDNIRSLTLLKLSLQVEFILDDDSGTIVQQRLLETRINDQLTPGDVVSRWVRRLGGDEERSAGWDSGIRDLFVDFVRSSMQQRLD